LAGAGVRFGILPSFPFEILAPPLPSATTAESTSKTTLVKSAKATWATKSARSSRTSSSSLVKGSVVLGISLVSVVSAISCILHVHLADSGVVLVVVVVLVVGKTTGLASSVIFVYGFALFVADSSDAWVGWSASILAKLVVSAASVVVASLDWMHDVSGKFRCIAEGLSVEE